MIRCLWPTTAKEAWQAARAQERRERWVNAQADSLRAQMEANSARWFELHPTPVGNLVEAA